MKEMDAKRWKQLEKAETVSLGCTQEDLDKFITINNTPYARSCVNFLITQHLKFRLHIDDYKKEIKFLREERDKIVANAANEMRKKMVLIEKLQTQNQLQVQKYRAEQILSAENTIDDHEEEDSRNDHGHAHSPHLHDEHGDDGHETDNDTMMALDETDNEEETGNGDTHSPPRYATPVPLDCPPFEEMDRQRMSDELDQSKKLLNLYRSPMHRHRTRPTPFSAANSVPFTMPKLESKIASNKFTTPFKKASQVLPSVADSRVSVQLTPFHTPSIKSKSRLNLSSHSNSHSNSHSGHHGHNQPKPYSFLNKPAVHTATQSNNGSHSVRSVSASPLGGDRGVPAQNTIFHANTGGFAMSGGNGVSARVNPLDTTIPDLAPITEQHHPVIVGGSGRTQNVWSRLTNPRHFVSTSRTRAQELQILKEKVRKQKESHHQIQQKKASWKKHKNAHSPEQQGPVSALLPRDHQNQSLLAQSHHHHPMSMDQSGLQHDDEDDPNKSVFMRLHATSIRNTRTHLNSSLNGEEAMMIGPGDHEPRECKNGGAGFLMNEPSRIVNQSEIFKKPQRNPQANANKSMLTLPARVLTPDDDI